MHPAGMGFQSPMPLCFPASALYCPLLRPGRWQHCNRRGLLWYFLNLGPFDHKLEKRGAGILEAVADKVKCWQIQVAMVELHWLLAG